MQAVTSWLKNKTLLGQIKSTGILLIPVALYLVPVDWLDRQHSICLFKNTFGIDCYGCGMTRAILSALHFHFDNAYHYNKLFVIVMPLLVYLWTMTVIKSGKEKPAHNIGLPKMATSVRNESECK
jgi:hypothetical protein